MPKIKKEELQLLEQTSATLRLLSLRHEGTQAEILKLVSDELAKFFWKEFEEKKFSTLGPINLSYSQLCDAERVVSHIWETWDLKMELKGRFHAAATMVHLQRVNMQIQSLEGGMEAPWQEYLN